MDQPQKVDLVMRWLMSMLDELSGVLRLYFVLGTGAFVLFTNLLSQSRPTKVQALFLFLSIAMFGVMAVCSLGLLLKLAGFRQTFASAIAAGISADEMKSRLEEWSKRATFSGHLLDWLFRLAIVFAAMYTLLLVWARLKPAS